MTHVGAQILWIWRENRSVSDGAPGAYLLTRGNLACVTLPTVSVSRAVLEYQDNMERSLQ
jgi:hypothetical protein